MKLKSWFCRTSRADARNPDRGRRGRAEVGRELYEKFFRGYTRKQWGLDPSELDAAVTARIPTRTNRDDRYFTDTYQVDAARRLHPDVRADARPSRTSASCSTRTSTKCATSIPYASVIYTGPIDAYFDYRYGKLPYRSLRVPFETLEHRSRPAGRHGELSRTSTPYTRITEFKHLTGQVAPEDHASCTSIRGPRAIPTTRCRGPKTQALYKQYEALAQATPDVHFVGRLATYRYYNMDQVVAQALTLHSRIEKTATNRSGIAARANELVGVN